MMLCGIVSVWREMAACRDSGLDWFVDERSERIIDRLLAICGACRVSCECLSDALAHENEHSDTWGVRGGLRASERRSLRMEVA